MFAAKIFEKTTRRLSLSVRDDDTASVQDIVNCQRNPLDLSVTNHTRVFRVADKNTCCRCSNKTVPPAAKSAFAALCHLVSEMKTLITYEMHCVHMIGPKKYTRTRHLEPRLDNPFKEFNSSKTGAGMSLACIVVIEMRSFIFLENLIGVVTKNL